MMVPATASKFTANSSKIAALLKTIGNEVNDISLALGDICRRIKENRINELKQENEKLEKQVEVCCQELRGLRSAKGIPQLFVPTLKSLNVGNSTVSPSNAVRYQSKATDAVPCEANQPQKLTKNEQTIKQKKQNSTKDKKITKSGAQVENEEEPHIGRLDIRIGKIIDVQKHPNADSLYVEKVDIGEEKPRTIISGLVNHVPIEDMKNRIALFLVNLKPAKMRGIDSEGMIMCANLDNKVEILVPPEGVQPGEFVTVDGYERKPDAQLNTKKKTFELVQVDMKTNEKREATYKGILWNVGGKGVALSPTLINASIK